jgi:hypothetical protein
MSHVVYTKIKIISLALTFLGKGPINSVADAGEFAESVEDAYDLLYPSIIAEGWRFATKTQQLTRLDLTSDLDEWQFIYQLPVDILTIIKIEPRSRYMVYGTKLYTNVSSDLIMEYVFLPPEEILPPYFVRYVAYRLAADMAWSVSRDKQWATAFESKATQAMVVAQSIEGRSIPNTPVEFNPYIRVRMANPFGSCR